MAVQGVRVVGLDKVIVEFELASIKVIPEAEKVVGFGCNSIKKDWQATWKAAFGKKSHLGALPYSISYDVTTTPGHITGETGPDLNKKQGPLGGIAEFGSPTSAPHPGGAPALDAEAPRFEAAMLALTERLLP